MKKWLVVVFLLISFCLPSNAFQKLDFKGFIADEANLLSDTVKNDLNMTLWDLQKKSGADIVVVTLPSLNGRTVEDVALDIGRSYKLGAKGKNNGVVFLTALSERKMRIELGVGLENRIQMSALNNIRDYDILPYFRKSNYQDGISRGTYQLVDLVARVEGVQVKRQGYCPDRTSSSHSKERAPWWCYVLAFILAPFMPRRSRFGYGSFSGFGGGGGFGGCGCSGSW